MTKQERYEQTVKSYEPFFNIVSLAKSAYFDRYTLSVDTAGKWLIAGRFRTKSEAVKYRKDNYPNRSFMIDDKWDAIAKPILDDMKFIMSYLKLRRN